MVVVALRGAASPLLQAAFSGGGQGQGGARLLRSVLDGVPARPRPGEQVAQGRGRGPRGPVRFREPGFTGTGSRSIRGLGRSRGPNRGGAPPAQTRCPPLACRWVRCRRRGPTGALRRPPPPPPR